MEKIFDFGKEIEEKSQIAMDMTKTQFERVEEITEHNQQRMLKAFIDNNVAQTHMLGTTGYGYGDDGKTKACRVLSDYFCCEDAIISYDFACGTHTLTVALFGLLRPGDNMLCITGRPYDTICPVIGIEPNARRDRVEVAFSPNCSPRSESILTACSNEPDAHTGEYKTSKGSLADFGINYIQCDLDENGEIDLKKVKEILSTTKIKLVYIQRSRGYSLRQSFSVEKIRQTVDVVKENSDAIVFVDNCYGEFTETQEPTAVGADIVVGSLIKNAGGGIAKRGGYIAGRHDLVELCSYRLTSCSLGFEVGATLNSNGEILMGLFNAPHVTGEALKTAIFASALFSQLSFETTPKFDEERHDIVQAIQLKNSENLIAFCEGLQECSPVDSFATPEPDDMPGYDSKVIMAAGTFVSGASIELSGDAPLREPFAVWMQGGINFHSAKIGIMNAARRVLTNQMFDDTTRANPCNT